MPTRTEAVTIIERFIATTLPRKRWYVAVQPNVHAVVLYGSVAKGQNRPDSDIDILIILPLNIEEAHTTGEYVYNFEGHEINIVLRSIERLRDIAKEGTDRFQKEVFRGCHIFSATTEAQALITSIAAIRE